MENKNAQQTKKFANNFEFHVSVKFVCKKYVLILFM